MSGIFISHSSHDKEFVRRLAMDLLDRDFNVWYDEWHLQVGAKLSESIKAGVDETPYFLIVLSRNMLESDWVQREIAWALDAENASGRLMLLPIKVDECDVPSSIADRLYADFSSSYAEPLEALTDQLQHEIPSVSNASTLGRELIPLFVQQGIYLDEIRLQRKISRLRERGASDYVVRPEQFRISDESGYSLLRKKMLTRLENIESDSHYSPDFVSDYRNHFNNIRQREKTLLSRLAAMITERGIRGDRCGAIGETCHWYWRIARTELIGAMYNMQNPDDPDGTEYGKEYLRTRVEEIYGVDELTNIHVMSPSRDRVYCASIDKASSLSKSLYEFVGSPDDLSMHEPKQVNKWILPQVVHREPKFNDWNSIDTFHVGLR